MPKRNLIWAIAILAAAAAVMVLVRGPRTPQDDRDQIRFRPVVRAYKTIRQHCYHPVDDAALQRGSIRGMVEQLDEYSSYVPPDKIKSFQGRLDGYVAGLGLRYERTGDAAEVIGALPGSPAHRADIRPGWRVIEIDGSPVADLPEERLTALLNGQAEPVVELVLVGPAGRRRTVELARRRFAIQTVTGLCRTAAGRWDHFVDTDREIAYVRITELVPAAVHAFRRALHQVSRARGLVLDLRGNPGGHLEVGLALANLFLADGVIFTRLDRLGRAQSFSARSAGTRPHVPIVVLVDGETASAAEIVAGALRRHDRAVLVGTRTRGKGFVQSLIVLPDDLGQVNLTTAEILIGRDQPIAHRPGRDTWGIEPHRTVPLTPQQQAAIRRLRDEAEVAATPPGPPATRPVAPPATAPASRPAERCLAADPQLALAVQLLKTKGAVADILAEAAAERERRKRPGGPGRPEPNTPAAPHDDE